MRATPSPSRDAFAASPRGLLARRDVLRGGLALGGAVLAQSLGAIGAIANAATTKPAGSDFGAIEHVVFLMQENRSYDHYFGAYRRGRGFDDHPVDSLGAFAQPSAANTTRPPTGVQLPFHLDTSTGVAECTHDIDHGWYSQHRSWNSGQMDSFVSTHTWPSLDGPEVGLLTMGYYKRADLPYHYALADNFTLCDAYFASVLGPTHPNRVMSLAGSIDPAGLHGGPVLVTSTSPDVLYRLQLTTVPELLQDKGVSWKTYTTPGQGFIPSSPDLGFGDSTLQLFAAYRNPASPLFRKAFLPTYPADFVRDVKTGRLPRVSWIISPNGYDEHSPAPPAYGAWFIDQVLRTLFANPKVWAKTVVFITYDEGGGFFDHVAPPVAPPGTTDEFISASPLPGAAQGVAGPVGLGFRVPMLVVSPFSRGGRIVSDVFDHTSQIRFLETRFGIRSPNISSWRRQTVGDLTSTLRPGRAVMTAPRLPSTRAYRARALTVLGCTPGDVNETALNQPAVPQPATQSMPVQ